MIIEQPTSASGYAFMVITGYKAGLTLVNPPPESLLLDQSMLKTEWIISNWGKWIYPEYDIQDVYIIPIYSVSIIPPT